jgi:pilus assembly protein Flp/PilA
MYLGNNRGQSLIEYVILVALVGVATMGMVRLLQKSVKVNLAQVVNAMEGDTRRLQGEKVTVDDMRKADFTNFMSGEASDENH